jgi:hypothetical protein
VVYSNTEALVESYRGVLLSPPEPPFQYNLYPVIAALPLEEGATQPTLIYVCDAEVLVGALGLPGTLAAMTLRADELGPVPAALIALTMKW